MTRLSPWLVMSMVAVGCGSNHPAGGSTSGSGGSSSATGSSGSSSTSSGNTSSSSSGYGSGSPNCPGFIAPNSPSPCSCSGRHCSTNNCSDGNYCQLSNSSCAPPPYLCTIPVLPSSGSSGAVVPEVTWTGSVTADGGTVSTLYFAVVGDTRPSTESDTSNYPVLIIQDIFQDIQAMNAEFIISTGDYQYADPSSSSDGAGQLALYAQARAAYAGVLFPTLGNHECDGYTADNCDSSGNITVGGSGKSQNFAAFKSTLLAPINQSLPYYAFEVDDAAGQWTAKFVVTAANAWDTTQQAWLQQVMAVTTTYTFVMRHESTADNTAPGVNPSDTIIDANPYTLKIVGHSHYFSKAEDREIIVGNGGAPLDSSNDSYGYALLSLTDGGDVQVQEMNFQTNVPISTFVIPK